jgi:hypothetical protein
MVSVFVDAQRSPERIDPVADLNQSQWASKQASLFGLSGFAEGNIRTLSILWRYMVFATPKV